GGRLPAVLDGLPRLRADAGRGRRRRGLARPGHEDAVALMRYFLVDKVTELVPGERIRGVECVSLSDEVVHDHFPDFPVMPGALIVEAGAQLAGFLLEATFNQPGGPLRRALMVQIQDARFHETVGPGETLDLLATLESRLEAAAQARIEAHVGE